MSVIYENLVLLVYITKTTHLTDYKMHVLEQIQSFVQRHELSDGPIVGSLNIGRKVACWKFIMLSMTSHTFTTSTL
jgi:hypothetical protein